MIRNEREFTATVTEWISRAKADLQQQLIDFMDVMQSDVNELAAALHVDPAEIEAIVSGEADTITLDTFAKILVGSNHILEIKPLDATPFGGFGDVPHGHMPPMRPPMGGRMAPPPMGNRMGGRMTPPPMGGMPPMPPMGNPSERFCGMPGLKRKGQQRPPMGGRMTPPPMGGVPPMPEEREVSPMDRMSRKDIIDTIRANQWDSEIDMTTATRAELIDFLSQKNFMTDEVVPQTPRTTEPTAPKTTDSSRIAELLAAELERNPQLKEVIGKYLKEQKKNDSINERLG